MADGRARLVCPKCDKPDGLWEECMVPGWQSMDAYLDENGRVRTEPAQRGWPEREVDWNNGVVSEYDCGCSHCGWEGRVDELVRLGLDGKPLPRIHPAQERLA